VSASSELINAANKQTTHQSPHYTVTVQQTCNSCYNTTVALIPNITAHLQNCTDDVQPFSRPDVRSTLVTCTLLYTPLLHVRDCDQLTTETSSFHVCGRPNLAAAASACVVRQFGTNFHRICEGNSLSIALSTGYSSVLTAGGASDRR